jgi:predicted component of type VI protein secretion system
LRRADAEEPAVDTQATEERLDAVDAMPVTIKIFTKQAGRPTLFQTRDFETLPVTIGRDATCSVVLEDPLKHISRVHVELEEEDGTFWMSVISKVNPVLVKGRRYGSGTRLTLESGDSFEMGEFEVQVLLPEKPRPATAEADKKSLINVFAEDSDTGDAATVPPPEAGIFEESTFVGAEPTYTGPALKPTAAARKSPAAEAKPLTPPASMNAALRVFLEGAGMPHKELSATESERLLRDCGAVLRAAIEGLMMLVIARAEMRKAFEAEDRTMVTARDNNPLKLMADSHEAMQFLLDPGERTDGFLDPIGAIGDACEDLRAHELAVIAGMRGAILGALSRLDAQVLEKTFEKSAGGFFLGGRKAKYWDAFVAYQQQLSREAQQDFDKVFGRDFVSAYHAQLRRLKSER